MTATHFDDSPVTDETLAANRRHDAEHGHPQDFEKSRIHSGWNESRLTRRGKLTDRQIAKYERAGYYTGVYRAARKELMDKKAKKRRAREGNLVLVDGRLVYNL